MQLAVLKGVVILLSIESFARVMNQRAWIGERLLEVLAFWSVSNAPNDV